MKKAWSFTALVVLFGVILYALPRLPRLGLTGWDGVFSLAWLSLAGCVATAHISQLKRPRQKYAKLKLRKPKEIVRGQRIRGQG